MSASLTCVRDLGPTPGPTLAAVPAAPLCKAPGADPNWWYPAPGDRRTAEFAKQICASCPLRELCLTAALDSNERHGIWAGLSPSERQCLPRRHPCRKCGTPCSTRYRYCGDGCRAAARAARQAAYSRRKRLGMLAVA
jgi:Transcription factor WhiB